MSAKSVGGFPYQAFTKLFESTIAPIVTYGASIWAHEEFSCINAVQHRAARYFLMLENIHQMLPSMVILVGNQWYVKPKKP